MLHVHVYHIAKCWSWIILMSMCTKVGFNYTIIKPNV